MKRILIGILIAALLLGIGIPVKLFLIGEPADGQTVVCEVTEDDHQINIYVSTPASAVAFKGARLRQEGTTLYITMRKVLVSPLYSSGSHCIYLEKGGFTEIYLGGERIWTE